MRKFAWIFISALTLLWGCGNNGSQSAETGETAEEVSEKIVQKNMKTAEKIAAMSEEPVFDIITSMGIIKVRLYADTPKHRENFAKLAFEGFYDGILFHRVINGFMIQAGDPLTKDEANAPYFGTGGPGYTIPAEFVAAHTHKKGALAAARKGDMANPLKESSGSQFYLVQDENACAALDGDYTVFGETIDGFQVIDAIAAVQTGLRDRPVQDVKIISVKYDEALNPGSEQ